MRKVMQAFVLANKSQMTNEEWKEARKQGIGGSDAGAILGLNPYCSALQVCSSKSFLWVL